MWLSIMPSRDRSLTWGGISLALHLGLGVAHGPVHRAEPLGSRGILTVELLREPTGTDAMRGIANEPAASEHVAPAATREPVPHRHSKRSPERETAAPRLATAPYEAEVHSVPSFAAAGAIAETGAAPAIEPQQVSPQGPLRMAANLALLAERRPGSATAVHRQAQEGYLRLLRAAVEQHRRYPRAARRAHIEGRVVVRMSVDRWGRLTAATVRQSSGAVILDEAALEAVRSAAAFPAAPADVMGNSFTLDLPMDFRLASMSQ